MRLRPRQSLFVERSLAALCDHGNTLSIASTGFGKTIALSAVVAKSLEGSDAKACILAHRDELTAQNRAKFSRVAPDITTSVVDAEAKSWAGRATFAMVPTLSRPSNLAAMPALDLLVIDEAHHAVAESYRRIIDYVRGANPACRIFGVTATPNRGDRKGLREIFDNVGDQVRLSDASYAALGFTPAGRGLVPFAPAHVEQPWRTARSPGDLTIRWTRRSRALVADAWEQVEVPLAEDLESYDVQILDGATIKRTLTSSTTSVLYTAAQQSADWGAPLGPGQTLAIRIYQLSNRLGRGTPATVTLQF